MCPHGRIPSIAIGHGRRARSFPTPDHRPGTLSPTSGSESRGSNVAAQRKPTLPDTSSGSVITTPDANASDGSLYPRAFITVNPFPNFITVPETINIVSPTSAVGSSAEFKSLDGTLSSTGMGTITTPTPVTTTPVDGIVTLQPVQLSGPPVYGTGQGASMYSTSIYSSSTLSAPSTQAPPIATNITFRATQVGESKKIILASLTISIFLVCSGLLALHLWRRRSLSIPKHTVEDSELDGRRGEVEYRDDQAVAPFNISPSNPTGQHPKRYKGLKAYRVMRSLRRNHFSLTHGRNTSPEIAPPPLISVSACEAEMEEDARPMMKGSIPPQAVASHNGSGRGNSLQPSEEVEALRERLRAVENIALSLSDHTTGTDNVRNLERELRELIPPPEYTKLSHIEI